MMDFYISTVKNSLFDTFSNEVNRLYDLINFFYFKKINKIIN